MKGERHLETAYYEKGKGYEPPTIGKKGARDWFIRLPTIQSKGIAIPID